MPDAPNDSSSPANTDPTDPPKDDEPTGRWPRWRRPVLLVSATSLLTIGVLSNMGRLAAPEPEALSLDEEQIEQGQLVHARFAMSSLTDDEGGGMGTRHKGEEGKMGKPTSKQKSGMYAVPQMARNFDPQMAQRNAGILGTLQQDSAHFLASPHGGAFAVGNDDEDVWGGMTGTEIGESYGVGGLGLVGTGRGGGGVGAGQIALGQPTVGGEQRQPVASGEGYDAIEENTWTIARDDSKSTFSIDVDTAAYSNVRRFLTKNASLPPPDAVRVEEMINYFDYGYAPPDDDTPFSVTSEVGPCPWNPEARLVHVGLQGKVVEPENLPPRNLVFLVDVSGSMSSVDKLPLVQRSLAGLTEQLDGRDKISLVVYAGAAGTVLEPTSGADKATILEAIARLQSGGSTHGSAGIEQAYALAHEHFVEDGINRVILATDGDFNVGVTDRGELVELIERERKGGVFLSVLGFGMGNLQDATMEQLADHGNGNYAYIDGLAEARKVLVEQAGATLVTIAKDVKIQVEFDPEAVERFRLVGYENRVLAHRDFDDDTKDAGEIGAGHTVTALYEIVSKDEAEDLGELRLRYKEPDGDDSNKIDFELEDGGDSLEETSIDFRFSAAVASFGMLLRQSDNAEHTSWASTRALAMESMGTDPMCRRHEMVALIGRAAELAGQPLPPVTLDCAIDPGRTRPGTATAVSTGVSDASGKDDGTWAFILEVLHLLPPLLALPLFIMAARDPYRRRKIRT